MSSFENKRELQQLCNNFSARVKKLDEDCNELPGQRQHGMIRPDLVVKKFLSFVFASKTLELNLTTLLLT
jgi:hypothetical protein